ncbi:MAG: hypothetical protein GXP62_06235 [Oligoflexia bacterium]|nr:hypothetical protein [Oligoflexia bacterium]
MKVLAWLLGGGCVATGIIAMSSGGIGIPGGPTATQFGKLGFDALPEVAFTGQGYVALGLLVVGIGMLVAANRGAWQDTGGY